MRASRLSFALVLAVLLLSGCVPDPAAQPSEPHPSSTPVFASEDEALAAAVAAYENYLRVSDEIAADGGANPERLKDLVTEEWYEKEVEVFEIISEAGVHQMGSSSSRNANLQQFEGRQVAINVCADASATRYVDADGRDVALTERTVLFTNEVLFEVRQRGLILQSSTPWPESSLC